MMTINKNKGSLAKVVKMYDHKKNIDFREKWKQFIKPSRKSALFLINMQMRNGDHTWFLVNGVDKETFDFAGGVYLIDESLKYFVGSSGLYGLDYHQELTIPIERKIDVSLIKEAIKQKATLDEDQQMLTAATNPRLIGEFIDSKVIEGVFRGQSQEEFFRTLKLILTIILVLVIIIVLFEFFASGIVKL